MSTRVVTISTCDRCGTTHEEEGASHGLHPGVWFVTATPHLGSWLLCPACVRDIEFVLNDKPVRGQA